MPELPEVETVARELRQVLPGEKIESVLALNPASFENRAADQTLNQNIRAIDWTEQTFCQALNRSDQGIKALLLSQSLISGLGNIYTDEVLFASGIHPRSISSLIAQKKKIELFRNINATLRLAIAEMGSTISDYRTVNGQSGNFQNYFKVYSREGKPCPNCARPIKKIKTAGRSTHYCSFCQRLNKK